MHELANRGGCKHVMVHCSRQLVFRAFTVVAFLACAACLAFSGGYAHAAALTVGAGDCAGVSVMSSRVSIDGAKVSCTHSAAYTGQPVKPKVKVALNGKRLRKGRDFKLVYAHNVSKGHATVRVIGKGRYRGRVVKHFTIRQRKLVMIGNSSAQCYGRKGSPDRIDTPWPELVAQKLGLTDGEWTVYRKLGYSVARTSMRWVTLFAKVPVDRDVTDVIIVGGTSCDRARSAKLISREYERLVKTLREKYPNARIGHASTVGKRQGRVYQARVNQCFRKYRAAAKKNGVYWFKKCRKVLKSRPGLLRTTDRRHPNQAGSDALASALVMRIHALDRRGLY